MPQHSLFPSDYAEARERFCRAAQTAGWNLDRYPLPTAADLSIDVARHGHVDAPAMLVITSGLHGIEGFLGSTFQSHYLAQLTNNHPGNLQTLLIHSLNPFGFANLRRADSSNIDLNRNFLLDDQPYRGSPEGYATLYSLLSPDQYSRFDFFLLRLLARGITQSPRQIRQSIAQGQYDYPTGLFFGGQARSENSRILESILRKSLGDHQSTRIIHLDIHTGLGRWGKYKLLVDYSIPPADRQWLDRHFGAENIEDESNIAVAYNTRGSLGRWCRHKFSTYAYHYFCVEFGTYSPLNILTALRRENLAHYQLAHDSFQTQQAKRQLKECFAPASVTWQQTSLRTCQEIVKQATIALTC